jgi:hypothetical protein
MIALNDKPEACWQNSFLEILPEIKRRLRMAFCRLSLEARDEAIEEAIVSCLFAYARLHEQGRTGSVTPSNLAWYAALQVKSGRPTVGSMNGTDPLSRYAQLENGIQVEQSKWIDLLVEDKRASVPDQVAAKMDVGDWFATLSRRMKQIARDLAFGFSTSEVAKKYGVTAGRISQLRRMLENSWAEFQQDVAMEIPR